MAIVYTTSLPKMLNTFPIYMRMTTFWWKYIRKSLLVIQQEAHGRSNSRLQRWGTKL